MEKFTHLIFSFGIAWCSTAIFKIPLFFQFTLGILGSFIGISPDWFDFKFGAGKYHRNRITHNFLSPLLLIVFILGWVLGELCLISSPMILGLIYIGVFESHIGLDSITFSGVYLDWYRKIHGKYNTHDFKPNILFSGIGILLILVGFL